MNIKLRNIYEWPLIRQFLVLGLIFIVVVYAGYWWDLSSSRADLESSAQQENDLKQQLQTIVDKQTNLKNDIVQLSKLQALLTEWQKKLIKETELPEVMNEILKIGGNNQLYFLLFSPGDEAADQNYVRQPIKTIVVGSYHQLGDFVSQLANLKWIVVIKNFNFSNENKNDLLGAKLAEQANANNLLTAELQLDLYKIPQPGELERLKSKDIKPGQTPPAQPNPPPKPGDQTNPKPQTPAPATPPASTPPAAKPPTAQPPAATSGKNPA